MPSAQYTHQRWMLSSGGKFIYAESAVVSIPAGPVPDRPTGLIAVNRIHAVHGVTQEQADILGVGRADREFAIGPIRARRPIGVPVCLHPDGTVTVQMSERP